MNYILIGKLLAAVAPLNKMTLTPAMHAPETGHEISLTRHFHPDP